MTRKETLAELGRILQEEIDKDFIRTLCERAKYPHAPQETQAEVTTSRLPDVQATQASARRKNRTSKGEV